MSVAILSNAHLSAIARAVVNCGADSAYNLSLDTMTAEADVFFLLLDTLRQAYHARYNEAMPIDGPAFFQYPSNTPDVVQVLKLILSYEYQVASEEFQQSTLHAALAMTKDDLIGRLPGYDEASWTI